jgi:hypothetical protein
VFEAIKPVLPKAAVKSHPINQGRKTSRTSTVMGLASVMPGPNQSGVLQNSQVLGYCWLGYAGLIGQHPHSQFPFTAQTLEQRPPGGVSKSREDIS